MKKVFFVAALSLGSIAAFAQDVEAVEQVATESLETTKEMEVVEEKEAIASEAAEEIKVQDAFAEVTIEEVPETVVTALASDYPAATITKAYANEAQQYKLEVAKEDGSAVELYIDADGNFIEM